MLEIEAILILLVVVAALATLANKIKVPYPILLVLGGLVLGFVPGLPRVEHALLTDVAREVRFERVAAG